MCHGPGEGRNVDVGQWRGVSRLSTHVSNRSDDGNKRRRAIIITVYNIL